MLARQSQRWPPDKWMSCSSGEMPTSATACCCPGRPACAFPMVTVSRVSSMSGSCARAAQPGWLAISLVRQLRASASSGRSPSAVRAAVEDVCGAAVVQARTQPGDFSRGWPPGCGAPRRAVLREGGIGAGQPGHAGAAPAGGASPGRAGTVHHQPAVAGSPPARNRGPPAVGRTGPAGSLAASHSCHGARQNSGRWWRRSTSWPRP